MKEQAMDNTISNFENKLFSEIELEKDTFFLEHEEITRELRPLLKTYSEDFSSVNKLFLQIERLVRLEFEEMIFKLLSEYGYKKADDWVVSGHGKVYLIHFQWHLHSEGSKMYYFLNIYNDFLKIHPKGTVLRLLCFNNNEATRKRAESNWSLFIKKINNNPGEEKIKFLFVDEFANDFFGNLTRKRLMKSLVSINNKIENEIGYRVTEICTPKNLKKLSVDVEKDLKSDRWLDFIKELNLSSTSCQKLLKLFEQFRTEEKFKPLFGSEEYANSFKNAEWFYFKYSQLGLLDFTPIVCGYFKCVEQLLQSAIKRKGYGKAFSLCSRSESIIIGDSPDFKSTLGSQLNFLERNRDCFFIKDKDIQSLYFEKLRYWINTERNGYFHKDNINNINILPQIRDSTIFILFLTISILC